MRREKEKEGEKAEEQKASGTIRLKMRCFPTHRRSHRTTMSSDMKRTRKENLSGKKIQRRPTQAPTMIELALETTRLTTELTPKVRQNGFSHLKYQTKLLQYREKRKAMTQVRVTT